MQPFNDKQIKAIRAIVQEELDAAKVRLADGLTDEEYAECKAEWQKANRYAKLKQERNNADEKERSQSKFDFVREYEAEEQRRKQERLERQERKEEARKAHYERLTRERLEQIKRDKAVRG
jgi:hypothetical protein